MTDDLTTTETQALATPATMPAGFENFTVGDLVIPRLRQLQALSKAVVDGRGKPGQWELTVADEIIDAGISIVPLSVRNGAILLEQGKGLVCRSNDGIVNQSGVKCKACPHNAFYDEWVDGVAPKCAATKDFLVCLTDSLFDSMPTIAILTFSKMSFKVGNNFASKAYFSGKDLFAASYALGSKQVTNNKGTFFVPELQKDTDLTGKAFQRAKQLYERFGRTQYAVSADDLA